MNYIILIIICIIHYFIINGLEKIMFNVYLPNNRNIRPNENCKIKIPPVKCLGMPSGHTEIITIIMYILYKNNIVTLPILILIILAMCIQRVLFKRHTILQTIIGVICGFIYSLIYLNIKNNNIKIVVSISFIIIYANIILYKITQLLNEPIPNWIDKNIIPIMNNKKNTEYYKKIYSIIETSILQNSTLFITWEDTEYYLDKIIEKIENTNIKYDAIVGIKSGGAIISDYISNKMNIKNYKIKVKDEILNCGKNSSLYLELILIFKKYIINQTKYEICEKIDDDLTNKNIILIDEQIDSGITMYTCIQYLLNKNINHIYPIVINDKNINNNVNSILTNTYFSIWPWGYDN